MQRIIASVGAEHTTRSPSPKPIESIGQSTNQPTRIHHLALILPGMELGHE